MLFCVVVEAAAFIDSLTAVVAFWMSVSACLRSEAFGLLSLSSLFALSTAACSVWRVASSATAPSLFVSSVCASETACWRSCLTCAASASAFFAWLSVTAFVADSSVFVEEVSVLATFAFCLARASSSAAVSVVEHACVESDVRVVSDVCVASIASDSFASVEESASWSAVTFRADFAFFSAAASASSALSASCAAVSHESSAALNRASLPVRWM